MCVFQSTYLYKVRPDIVVNKADSAISFNPRTYIRYDYTDEFCDPLKRVSIHVPI